MKKIMGMILWALLISNVSISAYGATSNLDKLYTSAFQSVDICKKSYNQQSINNARAAINNLKGTEASWAIGEFSKQVDEVQNMLFENFMRCLFIPGGKSREYLRQSEINRARDLVNSFAAYEGNAPYIKSWSSEVDRYQQFKIDEALASVAMAEETQKAEYVAGAKCAINTLMSAKNNLDLIKFAEQLSEKVDAIKITSGNINDYDTTGDVYDYKNYIKLGQKIVEYAGTNVKAHLFDIKFEDNLIGWIPKMGSVVVPGEKSDVTTYSYETQWQHNDYYKNMSPYACMTEDGHSFTYKENYGEIIRLVDGFVLYRDRESLKLDTFVPPALTKEQINRYKNSTYAEMLKVIGLEKNIFPKRN